MKFQETPGGATLLEVVGRLRQALAVSAPSSVPEFEERLMRAGYLDADQELYGFTRTALGELRAFSVREGFPRLTAQSVPPGIIEASYAIDEGQFVAFRLTQEELSEALRQMGGAHA